MTGPAPTIRRMKIEDYPLVYGLWTRCTGFTMRDIDDSEDAIKNVPQTQSRHLFRSRRRWRKDYWSDSCRSR